MLYQKIKIGEQDILLCCSASINVCYYNVFHKDFLMEMNKDEITNTFMEMAFIMAKFGELGKRQEVSKLTYEDYCDWLDQFMIGELLEAMPAIQEVYMAASRGTAVSKKNSIEPKEN